MKILIYTAILISIINCSLPKTQYNKPIDKMQWLIGNWKMKEANGTSTEVWKRMNDSTYTAISSMPNKEGKVEPFEEIVLAYENKRYFYIVTSANQNDAKPVRFEIAKITRTGFVAENLKHDFPKRITYTLVGRDSIQASIDDGLPKPKKIFYFNYKK